MVEAHRHARIVGQAELRVPLQGRCAPFTPSPPPRLLARMSLPRARFPRGHSASRRAAGERRWGATGGGVSGDRAHGRPASERSHGKGAPCVVQHRQQSRWDLR